MKCVGMHESCPCAPEWGCLFGADVVCERYAQRVSGLGEDFLASVDAPIRSIARLPPASGPETAPRRRKGLRSEATGKNEVRMAESAKGVKGSNETLARFGILLVGGQLDPMPSTEVLKPRILRGQPCRTRELLTPVVRTLKMSDEI